MNYDDFVKICDERGRNVPEEDSIRYQCWLHAPIDLRDLWINDTESCESITDMEIEFWEKFSDKDKLTLLKYGKFDYIYCWLCWLDTPIDIILIHHYDDDNTHDFSCEIRDILISLVQKYGMIDNKLNVVYDDIDIHCCLQLHRLIFYKMEGDLCGFPIPSYDSIPFENISRWQKMVEEKDETSQSGSGLKSIMDTLNWLENNVQNNDLYDSFPMDRRYG